MRFEHITQDWGDEEHPNEVTIMLRNPTDENITAAHYHVRDLIHSHPNLYKDLDEIHEISEMSYEERLWYARCDWKYTALMCMEDICKS